jgi:hypothetical protein
MKEYLIKQLKNISLKIKFWKVYGLTASLFFSVLLLSGYFMTSEILNFIILGWVLFITSCIVWWIWTIRIFQNLMNNNEELYVMIKSVASDVVILKENINELSKNKNKNTRQSK